MLSIFLFLFGPNSQGVAVAFPAVMCISVQSGAGSHPAPTRGPEQAQLTGARGHGRLVQEEPQPLPREAQEETPPRPSALTGEVALVCTGLAPASA